MGRIDRLSENQLLTTIVETNRALEGLRTTPQRFGSDSVKTHRIFSDELYDIEVTDVQFNNRVVEVTFTPDDLSSGLGGVLDFDFDITISGGFLQDYVEPLLPENGVTKWRIYLSGSDSFPIAWARLKFCVFANGSGTITSALI